MTAIFVAYVANEADRKDLQKFSPLDYMVIQKFSSCLKTLMLMNALLPKRTKRRERIEEEKTKKIREVVKLARL